MKLDRRHMVISVVMLVGSIIYNVWVFTGSGATATSPQASAPVAAVPESPSVSGGSAPFDPAQVRALADVALDRVPEWSRNPFENVRRPAEVVAVTDETPPPAPIPEADPVVATIMYSPDRRAAVVDGHIVRIGDAIGTSKVVDILPKAVVIESAERGRRTLEMRPATSGMGRK